ncbi:tRNA lysidine(34) synthetase TilS [[Haemophilus] felis]|nr:tRNA lysidine(34) synthetase TilS [[Haemophilus] felis]
MLFSQFEQQIKSYYPRQKSFLIGFSGGLDSTALLLLLAKLREKSPDLQLRAIHIHHGLSANADAWVGHCQQICQQLQIPFLLEKLQVNNERGIEAGARDARYHAIRQHLQPDEVLVTAHHQQDQTETFLLALKRGSGVSGLSAMQICSELFGLPIFRPLLRFTRQALLDYVQQQNVAWIEDESNEDNRYERNFLRNDVLPILRERWYHFDNAVQRSAQHCFEQQQLLKELLQETFYTHFDQSTQTFHLNQFTQYSDLKQKALLRLWLEKLAVPMPSTLQLNQLIKDVVYARQDSAPQFQLGETVLRRYQNTLYLTPAFLDLRQVKINVPLHRLITLPDNLGTLLITEKEQTQHQQLEAIWDRQGGAIHWTLPFTEQPIQVRFHYSGKVRLSATSAKEEMKKIWQQFHVPVWERQRTPLIFFGEKLQAALGYFNVVNE